MQILSLPIFEVAAMASMLKTCEPSLLLRDIYTPEVYILRFLCERKHKSTVLVSKPKPTNLGINPNVDIGLCDCAKKHCTKGIGYAITLVLVLRLTWAK